MPAMIRRLRHGSLLAIVLVASLLFQQVAVAAYACDRDAAPAPPPASAHCAGMDMVPAMPKPLCEKHCVPDLPVPPDAHMPGVPALALSFDFSLAPVVADSHSPSRDSLLPSGADPPPRLRYCSLLI